MSDQNSDTGHRPQVIDLEAEEIRSEPDTPSPAAAADETADRAADAETPPPPPPAPAKRKRSGTATWIIAALVLGALGGGFIYRGLLSDYLPSNRMTALANQVAALQQNNASLASELATVKQGADAAAQAAAAANDAAAQAGEAAKATQAKLGDIGSRLDEGDQQAAALADEIKSAKADLEGLRTTLSTAAPAPAPADGSTTTTTAAPADTAALAALAQRVAALEKDVASLKTSTGPAAKAGVTTALSQALSDLKAKVAAGTSYQAEYDRIARMVPAAAGLSTVGSYAADGLPDAKGLAKELTDAIPSLPTAAAPPAEDNSYFGMVMKSLSGIVTVRPIGETDWQQVAQKAADFASNGELTQAIAVIDAGEGEKPVAIGQWRDRARARLALEQATSELSEAVTRQIAAEGGPAQ